MPPQSGSQGDRKAGEKKAKGPKRSRATMIMPKKNDLEQTDPQKKWKENCCVSAQEGPASCTDKGGRHSRKTLGPSAVCE